MEDFDQRWERIREKNRSIDQRWEQMRKEQQAFDQRWEFLRKKQQETDEQIRKSLLELAQSIRKFQEASDSSVAPQVFDEKSKQKLGLTDFKLQGKTTEIAEQLHQQRQTTTMEVLELQTKKVNPENTDSYFIDRLKPENQFEASSYPSIDLLKQANFQDIPLNDVIEAPKLSPTFRSPLVSQQWPQTNHSFTKTCVELNPTFKSLLRTSPGTHHSLNKLKPKPTFRSPITTTPWTQNSPINPQILPETYLLPVLNQKTPISSLLDTHESPSVVQTIGPPSSYNHIAIIGSSLSISTISDPQPVAKALNPCLTSIRQRRPSVSKKGGVNDSNSLTDVSRGVRRKEFWLLSTVNKVLKAFIPRLSIDANGLSFQGWDDSYGTRIQEGLLKWRYANMNLIDFSFEVGVDECQLLYPFERGKEGTLIHELKEGHMESAENLISLIYNSMDSPLRTTLNLKGIHEHFLTMDQIIGGSPCSVGDRKLIGSHLFTPITMVVKLLDGYLAEVIGLDYRNAIRCSAEEGIGIKDTLNASVRRISSPRATAEMLSSQSTEGDESLGRSLPLNEQGNFLEVAIEAAMNAIIDFKDSLREWDSKVGEGVVVFQNGPLSRNRVRHILVPSLINQLQTLIENCLGLLSFTDDKLGNVAILIVGSFRVREKEAILVVVHVVSELHVAAMGNPGRFQCVWQIQFTAFIHSWGQECSEGEGIVTYARRKK